MEVWSLDLKCFAGAAAAKLRKSIERQSTQVREGASDSVRLNTQLWSLSFVEKKVKKTCFQKSIFSAGFEEMHVNMREVIMELRSLDRFFFCLTKIRVPEADMGLRSLSFV